LRFFCKTLFDITATGVTGHFKSSRIPFRDRSGKNIVDEIIVVDSGSTDATVVISQNLGAKVIFNEWPGYVKQKSFGESLCKPDCH
jgi:hypothetical protein